MDSIIQKIETNLNKLKIKNCSILVALSGGMDSMALLHLLSEFKDKYNLKLYSAYINHNLRNKDSIKEEKFVTDVTKKLNIPLYKYNVPDNFWKELKKQSIEMAARKIRYNFFQKISDQNNIDYIATAHNFNDKIETFFLYLFRGSGLDSLRSIPFKNKKIIRPLLNITRVQIEYYITSQNISYIHDITNDKNIYKRNIIRNKLLPVLKKIYPDFEKSFLHVFKIINEESKFLNNISFKSLKKVLIYKTDHLFCLNKMQYSRLPEVVQKNIIKLILKKLKYPALPSNTLLNILSGHKNNYLYRKNNFFSKSCKNYLWFINQNKIRSFTDNIIVNKIPFKYKNDKISITLNTTSYINPKKFLCFKFDKSSFPILIRGLYQDDKISINNKNKKNIKKILKDTGIPENIFKETIVIEANNKKIIGFLIINFSRISKKFYINKRKKSVLVNINFVNT